MTFFHPKTPILQDPGILKMDKNFIIKLSEIESRKRNEDIHISRLRKKFLFLLSIFLTRLRLANACHSLLSDLIVVLGGTDSPKWHFFMLYSKFLCYGQLWAISSKTQYSFRENLPSNRPNYFLTPPRPPRVIQVAQNGSLSYDMGYFDAC